ncbi:MAG: PilW family protein, partial [Deefgea sp.]
MHANTSINQKAIPKHHQGFTLIEVLVAMTLGLIIIGGAFSYFLSTLKTSKVMLSQSKLQQEIRASADLMQRDLRRAGYKPNGSTADVSTIYLGKTDAALSANNCVLYSYVNEQNVMRVSGFLLHNNKLYMYTQSGTANNDCPSSADTNSAWSP